MASATSCGLGASSPENMLMNVLNISPRTIDCGGWTRIFGSDLTGCDTIGCCGRDVGQPATVQWSVFEVVDLPCFCPMASDPGALEHNFVAQCQLPTAPVMEVYQTSTGCG